MAGATTRDVAYSLFHCEKAFEIILALEARGGIATATEVARDLGLLQPNVRPFMERLRESEVLDAAEQAHRRAPRYYRVSSPNAWSDLTSLARTLMAERDQGREGQVGGDGERAIGSAGAALSRLPTSTEPEGRGAN